jgi:hypothetical protein
MAEVVTSLSSRGERLEGVQVWSQSGSPKSSNRPLTSLGGAASRPSRFLEDVHSFRLQQGFDNHISHATTPNMPAVGRCRCLHRRTGIVSQLTRSVLETCTTPTPRFDHLRPTRFASTTGPRKWTQRLGGPKIRCEERCYRIRAPWQHHIQAERYVGHG